MAIDAAFAVERDDRTDLEPGVILERRAQEPVLVARIALDVQQAGAVLRAAHEEVLLVVPGIGLAAFADGRHAVVMQSLARGVDRKGDLQHLLRRGSGEGLLFDLGFVLIERHFDRLSLAVARADQGRYPRADPSGDLLGVKHLFDPEVRPEPLRGAAHRIDWRAQARSRIDDRTAVVVNRGVAVAIEHNPGQRQALERRAQVAQRERQIGDAIGGRQGPSIGLGLDRRTEDVFERPVLAVELLARGALGEGGFDRFDPALALEIAQAHAGRLVVDVNQE